MKNYCMCARVDTHINGRRTNYVCMWVCVVIRRNIIFFRKKYLKKKQRKGRALCMFEANYIYITFFLFFLISDFRIVFRYVWSEATIWDFFFNFCSIDDDLSRTDILVSISLFMRLDFLLFFLHFIYLVSNEVFGVIRTQSSNKSFVCIFFLRKNRKQICIKELFTELKTH